MGTHSTNRVGRNAGLIAVLLFASTAHLHAQRVQGIVLDELSHAPVKAADVTLIGTKGTVVDRELTGADGRFVVTIPRFGSYAIGVHALGYAPFTTRLFVADSSQQVSARVNLAPAPIALEGLEVTTTAVQRSLRKAGFYRREKLGVGYFVTPKEIREKHVDQLTDLFYGIPGARIISGGDPTDPTKWDVTLRSAGSQMLGADRPTSATKSVPKPNYYCLPSVSIDGTVVRHGGTGSDKVDWTTLVSPWDIAAVEVYASAAGAPAWVQGNDSPCGAIVIWTKDH